MTTITNPYDALYTNLKNRFTVIHDGCECTVGDFMRMRAGKSKSSESSLTVRATYADRPIIPTVIDFVSEKLTVRAPVKKDRTIRRFPLRTSMSAVLSAVAACALVFSCGIFSLSGTNAELLPSVDASYEVEIEDNEATENIEVEK